MIKLKLTRGEEPVKIEVGDVLIANGRKTKVRDIHITKSSVNLSLEYQ